MYGTRRRAAFRALIAWILLLAAGWFLSPRSGPPATDTATTPSERELVLEQENRLLRERLERARLRTALRDRVASEYPGFIAIDAAILPLGDPDPHARSLVIDVGRDDGVVVGYGVVGPVGLIGRVARTSAHRARVRLADDSSFRIEFQLRPSEREPARFGLLAGGPGDHELRPVALESAIAFQQGRWLETTGRDGVFPRGIAIGTVVTPREPYRDTTIRAAERSPVTETSVVVLAPAARLPDSTNGSNAEKSPPPTGGKRDD